MHLFIFTYLYFSDFFAFFELFEIFLNILEFFALYFCIFWNFLNIYMWIFLHFFYFFAYFPFIIHNVSWSFPRIDMTCNVYVVGVYYTWRNIICRHNCNSTAVQYNINCILFDWRNGETNILIHIIHVKHSLSHHYT